MNIEFKRLSELKGCYILVLKRIRKYKWGMNNLLGIL